MADGYARETGRLGVCCSTAGPGATNLLTGVACAYENHIPMLVLTGQAAMPALGRHPLQESSCTGVDVLGMFSHCTRYNTLVSHPRQFEHKLVTALQFAMQAPRGPVHLSLPADVFRSAPEAPVPQHARVAVQRRRQPGTHPPLGGQRLGQRAPHDDGQHRPHRGQHGEDGPPAPAVGEDLRDQERQAGEQARPRRRPVARLPEAAPRSSTIRPA